jgi:hypothetical protein
MFRRKTLTDDEVRKETLRNAYVQQHSTGIIILAGLIGWGVFWLTIPDGGTIWQGSWIAGLVSFIGSLAVMLLILKRTYR